MGSPARIDSIEALKNLRTFICNIARKISTAIDDADFEVTRTLNRLRHDQYPYWKKELRRRDEQLVSAKLALKGKRLLESAMGSEHYCTEEIKAVAVAQRRFDEAEDKLNKVSRWIPELERESYICRGALQSLSNFVQIDIPNKRAEIDEMIYALEAYVNLPSSSAAASEASVQRDVGDEILVSIDPADNMPSTSADMEQLCRDLRQKSTLKDLASSQLRGKLLLNIFKRLTISNEILEIIGKNKKAASLFCENDKLAIDYSVGNCDFIYFENLAVPTDMGIKWYIGPVEQGGFANYSIHKVSNFLKSNPSYREILSLPEGWLVILKNNIVEAVFSADNELVGRKPPEEKV